jgi:hypothetical protein
MIVLQDRLGPARTKRLPNEGAHVAGFFAAFELRVRMVRQARPLRSRETNYVNRVNPASRSVSAYPGRRPFRGPVGWSRGSHP